MLQLIFSGEYTKAMDQDWHSGHFSCWNCDMSLTGHRYILREEHPYCIKCYENLFANTCEECKTTIGTDSKVAYNNNNNNKITSVPTKALEAKLRDNKIKGLFNLQLSINRLVDIPELTGSAQSRK